MVYHGMVYDLLLVSQNDIPLYTGTYFFSNFKKIIYLRLYILAYEFHESILVYTSIYFSAVYDGI